MADQQASRLYNQSLVADHVCAQCFGRLVEKYIEDDYRVVCPRDCKPGGFVTQAWADKRKAESAAELEEVAKAYPFLDGRPKISAVDQAARKRALYGDEQ